MPPIHPAIVWTMGAVGAAALGRLVIKEWQRVNETLHARARAPVREEFAREHIPTLRRDPRTGIYRVERT